ncbi:PBS lyase HEAT-like repeat-containing protein [Paenibacillus sp. UNC496MF]|uniref:virulence factor n=1 Tax=Paenibacillus sp. UNC496MF TaxID=1502753 RepID=UPI0008E6821C|nr:virulence factor [Paenibacillus sp. UNC496MF]SFI87743.1 PBS lyase HEAT-like repeat-containing protein [Paenibacillus sp. UNC496MF]
MKLIGIEPTPSPNSMKLNVDEKLAPGVRLNYAPADAAGAPEPLRGLLGIDGVRGVFRTADFIALDRKPGADWERILSAARQLLQSGEDAGAGSPGGPGAAEAFGEAHAFVQLYRGIPIQVRVRTPGGETRAAMPAAFTDAVTRAAAASMIRERKLEELGVRYGEPEEIAAELVRELEAAYPAERLDALVEAALALGAAGEGEAAAAPAVRPAPLSAEALAERMADPDWSVRYEALDRTAPEAAMLPSLAKAIADDNASIRRLAVVYLGELRLPEAMPLLFAALKDASASVRRTAGDTLSDLGDPAAVGPMIEALGDRNKLVRWRAARFLYEAGDDNAVEALEQAAGDPEYEVSLQARIALERIQRGEEAAGSVWQQMTRSREGGQA